MNNYDDRLIPKEKDSSWHVECGKCDEAGTTKGHWVEGQGVELFGEWANGCPSCGNEDVAVVDEEEYEPDWEAIAEARAEARRDEERFEMGNEGRI